MAGLPLWAWAVVPLVSMLIALGVVWLISALPGRGLSRTAQTQGPSSGGVHFLFEHDDLADHDLRIEITSCSPNNWPGIHDWLKYRFPDLPKSTRDLPDGETVLSAADGTDDARLRIVRQGIITRLTLTDPATGDAAERQERMRLTVRQRKWGRCLNNASCGIVVTSDTGRILWTNTAFAAHGIRDATALFPDAGDLPTAGETKTGRHRLDDGTNSRWFETRTIRAEDNIIHYISNVTEIVTAETVRREFVQTLTKTFANLTTGLAVFDRDKQLALFNPALLDLTSLGPEFLSAQPNLMSFFDKLRDNHVLPEPRSYADWRSQILQMIEAASDGLYRETWSLPSGLTYRVTGRPHPDGAIAFLFEDITDEISLTRRFRSQVDLRQAVLDNLSDAVAVLSPTNTLLLCNDVCSRLLGIDPDSCFAELSLRDLTRICNERIPDPAFWSRVESRLDARRLAEPIQAGLTSSDDEALTCRITPLPGGASMLTIGKINPGWTPASHTLSDAG